MHFLLLKEQPLNVNMIWLPAKMAGRHISVKISTKISPLSSITKLRLLQVDQVAEVLVQVHQPLEIQKELKVAGSQVMEEVSVVPEQSVPQAPLRLVQIAENHAQLDTHITQSTTAIKIVLQVGEMMVFHVTQILLT